jgi:small subunit ribosomal protein S23
MKLHEEGQPLTTAYNQATKEFTALRARYEMASMAAELEARHHGAEFKETAFVSVAAVHAASHRSSSTD